MSGIISWAKIYSIMVLKMVGLVLVVEKDRHISNIDLPELAIYTGLPKYLMMLMDPRIIKDKIYHFKPTKLFMRPMEAHSLFLV